MRGQVRKREPLLPWYRLAVAALKPLALLLTRRRWTGQEHVPVTGGVIVAANHNSLVDPVVLCDYLLYAGGLVPTFMAKSTLFEGRGLVPRVMRGARQIPVQRSGGTGGAQSLDAAVQALREGACVVIYPEGTTTRDPDLWPMRAHTGVARLALLSGAPVLPVAHWGAARIHRRGRRGVRLLPPTRVQVQAGPVVDLTPYGGSPLDAEVLRAATETVMDAVTTQLELLRGETRPEHVHDPRSDAAEQDRRSA